MSDLDVDTPIYTGIVKDGTILGPFPSSDTAGSLITLGNGVGASGWLVCSIQWPTNILTAVTLTAGNSGGGVVAYVRHNGPTVTYSFSNPTVPAAQGSVIIRHTNRVTSQNDGPFTPSSQGQVLVSSTTGTLAQFNSQSYILWGTGGDPLVPGYCGAAKLYVRGLNAVNAAACIATLNDSQTGQELAGASCASATGSIGFADIWIPARPCSITATNISSPAQSMNVALVAA